MALQGVARREDSGMRVSSGIALTVALLVVGPLVLADAPQNDAGLGVDAGASPATATPLPGTGRYAGELRSRDHDWYTTLRTPGPVCVTLDAGGYPEATYTLQLQSGATTHFVTALLPTWGEQRLALAGSQVAQSWAGFVALPNPAEHDPARPGDYAFALDDTRASEAWEDTLLDDAGSALSGAFPLQGACTAGRLQPLGGAGDAIDLWTFQGKAGQQVVYTLGATAPVTLQLRNAAGAVGPAIAPDGLANVTLPADGQYSMQASAMGGSEIIQYIIGLTGPDPPPGSPCRPTCWTG